MKANVRGIDIKINKAEFKEMYNWCWQALGTDDIQHKQYCITQALKLMDGGQCEEFVSRMLRFLDCYVEPKDPSADELKELQKELNRIKEVKK